VGRRQTALACRVAARTDFEPESENEEAGLVVGGNDKNHVDLGITRHDGRRQVFLRKTLGGKTVEPIRYAPLPPGYMNLRIVARPLEYEFFYQLGDAEPVSLGTAATKDLSSEKIGGFTGVYFGMYATGNGRPVASEADFAWFDYEIVDR
jgi:alpha-N-arabinofuranosidase